MRQIPTPALDLTELLRVEPLASTQVAHRSQVGRQVLHVDLAESFDRIRALPPHSVVVLHAEAASGGWSLAAALQIAWQRNAAAVVVPPSAMSGSSRILAERLDITLLVHDADPVDIALTVAGQLSQPRATRALRVAQCAERLAEQTGVRGVLGVLGGELAPVQVALVAGSTVLAGRSAALDDRPDHQQVRVAVHGAGGHLWGELVASVPPGSPTGVDMVESLLSLGRLPVLAAWAQSRMQPAQRLEQEQASFQLLRRIGEGEPGTPEPAVQRAEESTPEWVGELGWRIDGMNRALWVTGVANTGEPAPELTHLVRSTWSRLLPDWPIAPDEDGWVSWWNGPADRPAAVRKAVRTLEDVLTRHGLVAGVGTARRGVSGLLRSTSEARLAAHVARSAGAGTVQWFEQTGVRSALAWLPVAQIAEVADLCLADLVSAKDRTALVETALAVLDSGGSLSQAAQRLGVHRNTVLARVARARELGVVSDDPAQRLALHVLCYALDTLWRTG
ncbi:PucR family transcriptional regulator [Nakamurella sp. YIM 132087]|uniref:PucR family transcriptional regulator n=1 Tax=Nakamurella alba TaxID=2665158 RepID=A0A7K1FQQ0_9ACTN|nr:helix-turn-helix domain-containing protein [Nakamurella alba]MTD15573.1 PucR family transcriptional regulator [Nakamurella alba]